MIAPIRGIRNLWRRSRTWKVVIVVVSIYIPVWLLWEVASRVMGHKVEAAWKFTERFGLPDEIEKLVGPEIAPEVNAAVPLREAVPLACEALARSPNFKRNSYGVGAEDLLDPSALAADPRYDSLLREADRRPDYRTLASLDPPYELTSYTIVMEGLRLASTEIAIARWIDEQGRHEEAVQRLVRLARLTRKWRGKEPTHYAADVNTAIEQSICFELNALLRKRRALPARCFELIESEFAHPRDVLRDNLAAMQIDRLECIGAVNYYAPTGGSFLTYPYDALDLVHTLEFFNRSMEHLLLPIAEASDAQAKLEEKYRDLAKDRVHRFFHPISHQWMTYTYRHRTHWMAQAKAVVRCLRIVNAMARQNAFDKDLDGLGVPADCLIDPFDGKRLRLKKSPEGPIVYSVASNLVDDDGDAEKDCRFGPPPLKAAKK